MENLLVLETHRNGLSSLSQPRACQKASLTQVEFLFPLLLQVNPPQLSHVSTLVFDTFSHALSLLSIVLHRENDLELHYNIHSARSTSCVRSGMIGTTMPYSTLQTKVIDQNEIQSAITARSFRA